MPAAAAAAEWSRSREGYSAREIAFQDDLLPELLKYADRDTAEYLAVVASTRASSVFDPATNEAKRHLRNIVTLFEGDIQRGAPEALRQARELLSE